MIWQVQEWLLSKHLIQEKLFMQVIMAFMGICRLIDHGLGLYSLYGHCSQLLVNEGDEVNAGETIAKTGVSGLALGDHLHFGF